MVAAGAVPARLAAARVARLPGTFYSSPGRRAPQPETVLAAFAFRPRSNADVQAASSVRFILALLRVEVHTPVGIAAYPRLIFHNMA
jgi:hypothetical protein